jgi:N,N-dimethylformamidase
MVVPGVHGYAEQSVFAGDKIRFRISGTVPYQLSVFRLGPDADRIERDELVHEFPPSEAQPQPIHPGSYVHIGKSISGSLKELTLECWVRPWKLKDRAGLITQFDDQKGREFGLFLGPAGSVSFCVGDQMGYDNAAEQVSAKNGVTTNRWYHLVATWDGRYRSIFINGERAGKWRFQGNLSPGKLPLRLAASGQAGRATCFLDGDLAMPVIYSQALSPAEVRARFEKTALAVPRGKHILAVWPFFEERGERIADASDHGRHGMIINHATWMVCGPSFSYEVLRFADYDPAADTRRGHALRFASDDLYDCRWVPSLEYKIPATTRSGLYVGRIAYQWEGKPHLYHITFVVRKAPKRRKASILVLAATNTWRAYNSAAFAKPQETLRRNCGTQGLPNSPGEPPAFSFYRRHAGGQGTYQLGLRMPFIGADPYLLYGSEYSHLARADRFTHIWLRNAGYDFDVITDLDLHREPEILSRYRVVVINGHSEYWSLSAWNGLDNYLRRGGNAVVLSGNSILWRVSFNQDCSIIECRKVDAPGDQMKPHERGEAWHSHDGQRGGFFRECGYPAYKLIGLDMLGFAAESCFGPYLVESVDHFLFHRPEETGLKAGDHFGQGPGGQMPRANGHEVDIRVSTFAALQELRNPAGGTVPADPPGITLIANGMTHWNQGSATAFDYFFREIKPARPQGAEMIYWERPEGGKVFNAGAIASGWALHADPKFQTLMRNVLAHFGVSPAV